MYVEDLIFGQLSNLSMIKLVNDFNKFKNFPDELILD
jgi:hypothetical protein